MGERKERGGGGRKGIGKLRWWKGRVKGGSGVGVGGWEWGGGERGVVA